MLTLDLVPNIRKALLQRSLLSFWMVPDGAAALAHGRRKGTCKSNAITKPPKEQRNRRLPFQAGKELTLADMSTQAEDSYKCDPMQTIYMMIFFFKEKNFCNSTAWFGSLIFVDYSVEPQCQKVRHTLRKYSCQQVMEGQGP